MPERKCDYEPLVKVSNGKAICPDNLFKIYKVKNACDDCPKARQVGTGSLMPKN
ncbi:MAG: hypothetical protein AAB531_05580 [Patescibacteria group bacterium]